MIVGIAAEQWRSAVESVEDFTLLKEEWEATGQNAQEPEKWTTIQANLARMNLAPWTMRHAFLVDMGGFLIICPDFSAFPIDGFQLAWLVKNDYLEYPEISREEIWDKNKANGFARALTIAQIAVRTPQFSTGRTLLSTSDNTSGSQSNAPAAGPNNSPSQPSHSYSAP
jgi:hypothetical protein